MPKREWIPANGFVFDGALFYRAKVKDDLIVTEATNVPIAGEPSLLVWYTKREFQNALARVQATLSPNTQGAVHNINIVAPSPELLRELKAASARLTRDHVLHMLTAGIAHARGFAFTTDEVKAFEAKADEMLARLEDAVLPAVQATQAA